MRLVHSPTCLAAACLFLLTQLSLVAGPAGEWIPLWNGRDFTGWSTWLNKPHRSVQVEGLKRDEDGRYLEAIGHDRDPLQVFTIAPDVDGQPAIHISGECFGELRSKQPLQDYHLSLQFKWGEAKWPPRDKEETPRDSGLLYHVHAESGAEGRNWSRSIELQIQEGDTGDLWAVGSAIAVRSTHHKENDFPTYTYDPKGIWNFFSQVPGRDGRCIKFPDAEKARGEWNTVELICLGRESIHIVNGVVVMRLHGPTRIDTPTPQPVTSGPIILQSEGAEIFYRDIRYRTISEVPAAYRE